MRPNTVYALAISLLLSGCGVLDTSIGDIQAHPRDYADKEVTLAGEVKEVYGLLFVRYFMLDDGSGEIGVVTDRPLPQKGEHLRVTGTIREAFSLGDRSTVVLIEKPSKDGKATTH